MPTLFGSNNSIITDHRDLLSLNPSEGELGFNILSSDAKQQHTASKEITKLHVESIIVQPTVMKDTDADGKIFSEIKSQNTAKISKVKKNNIDSIHQSLPQDLKPYIEQACDKGASSWLNALPIKEQNLDLNKEEFRDALKLRYNVPLQNLPTYCSCGERFNEVHAMSCKKGGFVSKKHDNIRDLLTIMLNKVCVDVQAEPHLIPVTNEQFRLRSANTSDEAR